MAKVTDFHCRDISGLPILCDAYGNNAAVRCPACGAPILLAFTDIIKRGSDREHPSECNACKLNVWGEMNETKQEIILHILNEQAEREPVCEDRQQLTLHEAMVLVLRECPGQMAEQTYLFQVIKQRDLYRERDGSPVKQNQIAPRAKNYSHLFEKIPANPTTGERAKIRLRTK